ncbi:MAG: polysaccharide deacetylase family protein [Winogradskyella sp.]|uniref:polysaccharide deacetylase family protein n=1 Tax=Winogradskyella sp. TaxID=1883156 RepID=UPI00179B0F91|nr:polysaccharide deacetylase family protein [Winogradskyella sp.]MBT8244961.1 polysaccharide deacetylase family protein [Winogradskyella sp.]NNK22197.1 polysaccharide deacetylase family protein [Winogradskyella sp.]
MNLIPARIPGFVMSLFPNFIWNIDTNNKELYLTFDDGPTPGITPWVLQQLKNYNAKATFFCIGSNIEKYPEIFEMIVAEGHSIGNHTYNHLKGWKHETKTYLEDIKKTQLIINYNSQKEVEYHTELACTKRSRSDVSQTIKLFRPPYGKLKTKQAKQIQKLGYKIALWDVLSFDWDSKVSEEKCYDNIINSAKAGSIIVMHDSKKAKRNLKTVLPRVLDYYNKRSFEFKAIS